jgi:RNA polymerase sigma factor (sigma-70 family)
VNTGVQQRGAAEDLGASYAILFRELGAAFRARGLGTEEANDLAQESLVRTFVHLKRHGRTQEDLRPLAHTIARRLYAERGRRLRPRFVDLPEAEHLADPTPEPIDQVVASEERADVHAALKALTPRHRRVVSLWMSGLRPAEIARELGIKRNAADALLHRARRQLASKLDPSRATLGLFGIAMLRMRLLFRRAMDAVSSLDPSGSTTQATAGLAVAGFTAALMLIGPANGGINQSIVPRNVTNAAESVDVTTSSRVAPAPPAESAAEVSDVPSVDRASLYADIHEHRAGADTGSDSPLGAAGDLDLDIWHERDPTHRGTIGPMLDGATDGACELLACTSVP